MTIQRTYNRYQAVGLPGAIARPNEEFKILRDLAIVALRPGQGVIHVPGTGWRLPTTTAERKLIDGVVGFDPTDYNVDLAVPVDNQTAEVVFAIGTYVKVITFGAVYVNAGATVSKGDGAIFNETTNAFIEYSPVAGDLTDFRTMPMDFLEDATDGAVVPIRIHSKVRF